MLLANWPLPEFAKFLQLITWIILPVLLLSVGVTLFLHYRNRKRKKSSEKEEEVLWFNSPESLPTINGESAHILFDHTGVIRQYQDKLSYHHARYAALQQDFKILESKYAAAIDQKPILQHTFKNTDMEKTSVNDQVIPDMTDKQVLLDRLEELDQSNNNLVSENNALLEKLNLYLATGDEKDILLNQWKEENTQLKNQVADQGYLKELLKEKKSQVEFLQNQVDEQIIIVHRLSLQQEVLRNELESSIRDSQETVKELTSAKHEVRRQDYVIEQLRADLLETENQLEDKESLIGTQSNQMTYLQTLVRETKEQNELLQAELADNHDKVQALQEQLSMEESRVVRTLQKLEDNQQMLKKFQRTISEYIGEEEETQVIELKPVYINSETEGWN